ncbi:MAG TPA: hypothetical protein VFI68_03005 [Anaerolineales bacterium]|nr:hypothetical protein [Anaerolineales bacterium]
MPKNTFPTEIEQMVQNISDVPEPNAVFLNSLREQFISKGIANAQKNTETKMIKISRRGLLSPRLIWGLGIALLIVALSLLASSPTVVNALKRMFGFMPGVGVVEQTSTLRLLAEPFSVEQDNISLNIVQVAVDSEKTTIIYEYPAIEVDYNTFQPPTTFKDDRPVLLLPDGTRLDVLVGRRISSSIPKIIGYSLEFPPLPNDVNDATLELTRLAGVPPGAGPEDWSIPFHVIPAPEGIVLPLVTINETEPATSTTAEAGTSSSQTPPTWDSTYGIKSTLESFVRMDDGYLLIGSVQWDVQNYPAYAVTPMIDYATATDAAGKSIDFEVMYGVEKPQNEEFRSYWAIKITDTNFQPPLEISITSMVVNFNAGSFQFDPGENPQPGQSFPLSVDVLVADKNVHFNAAQLNHSEFDKNLVFVFTAQTEPNFLGDVYVSMPIHQCMGGGGSYPTEPSTKLQIYSPLCRPDLPPGPLEVQITGGILFSLWVVTWQP